MSSGKTAIVVALIGTLGVIGAAFIAKMESDPDPIVPPTPRIEPPKTISPATTGLPCSAKNEKICIDYSAISCTQIKSTDMNVSDICRWDSIKTESGCKKTYGIWTTPASRFAKRHPGAVIEGSTGSCITQASNLRNSTYLSGKKSEISEN